jgi:hypothetical protein
MIFANSDRRSLSAADLRRSNPAGALAAKTHARLLSTRRWPAAAIDRNA